MDDTPQDAEPAPPEEATPVPEPPPQGAPPLPHRRLVRSDDGVLAGVAAGLGDYFQLDPLLFRIGFVVLTLFGGAGVVLYVIAALLMPTGHGPAVLGRGTWRDFEHRIRHRWIGIGLIVVAIAVLTSNVHLLQPGIVWGLALIVLGVLLFQMETAPWERAPDSHVLSPPPSGAAADLGAGGASSTGAAESPPPPPVWAPTAAWGAPPPPPRQREAARHRPRSPLGWITVALSFVAVGVAALLGAAGAVSLSVGGALAIALVVVGVGLVVSAFTRRAPGLILLGILLLPFVGAASLVDEPLSGGAGDRYVQPHAATELQDRYEIAAGRLTIDLTQAHLGGAPSQIHGSVAFGRLDVIVPTDLPVVIHGHVGAGQLDLLGRIDDGLQVTSDVSDSGSPGGRTLTIDARVGFGDIRVWRQGAPVGGP